MELGAWSVLWDKRLGAGGFADVYEAVDPAGNPAAAKVMPKAIGVSRDLLIADLPHSDHLVPVLHVEEVDTQVILFMPKGEYSLRDRLQRGDGLRFDEVLIILQEIAKGLIALDGRLVHRDLKPENVLYLDGKWAICDFGIARYSDAATATDTKKFAMSAPYAAPEQWKHERATSATDVYAFGVIAFELLTGARPFPGPTGDDYRRQHLDGEVPKVMTTKKLASLVRECLFSAPGARPTAENLNARLAVAGQDARTPGASALAEAHHVIVEARAAQHKAELAAETERERRQMLFDAAKQIQAQIVGELIETVADAAPALEVIRASNGAIELLLGAARVSITPVVASGVNLPYDIIASCSLTLRGQGRKSRSHSLYYADFEAQASYSWFELAFSGSLNPDFDHEPRSLEPGAGAEALGRAMGRMQLGRPILKLELGDIDGFVDAWSKRIGETAIGRFPSVSQLPEGNPQYPRR